MKGIFEGIRVVDFTNNVAGPASSALLADFGAEVIKVERPVVGDDIRAITPRLEGQSLQYLWFNRGKKSITVAMDDPAGVEALKKIIADAQVIVESFKPGTMKKFGLDYESVSKINPSIVYCSISACGQTGAYSNEPGFDVIAQGMSGIMDLTGEPDGSPVKSGVTIGDYVGSFNAFGAIAAALYHRQCTGEGQNIDISLMDGLISCNTLVEYAATMGANPTRAGRHHGTLAPYGIYIGKDDQSVIIAGYTVSMWKRLCNVMGRPDMIEDANYNSVVQRVKNINSMVEIIETWLKTFDDIEIPIKLMKEAGLACTKIRSTQEIVGDQLLWDNNSFVEIETPESFKETKKIKARGPWIRFSKTPAIMKKASDLGQYNYEIFGNYGFSKDEVDVLVEKWSSK